MSKRVKEWRRRLHNESMMDGADDGVEAAYMRFVLTKKRDEFVGFMDDGGCSSCSVEFEWSDVGGALNICLSHNEWWEEFKSWSVGEIEYELYQNAG